MSNSHDNNEAAFPALTLFVTGDAPRSKRARRNLSAALASTGRESLKPLEVDLLKHPEQSISYSVFATPALLKAGLDGGAAILYGDLSDEKKLTDFLSDAGC